MTNASDSPYHKHDDESIDPEATPQRGVSADAGRPYPASWLMALILFALTLGTGVVVGVLDILVSMDLQFAALGATVGATVGFGRYLASQRGVRMDSRHRAYTALWVSLMSMGLAAVSGLAAVLQGPAFSVPVGGIIIGVILFLVGIGVSMMVNYFLLWLGEGAGVKAAARRGR